MPSSKDRRRLEVSTHLHERLTEIAETEDRTIASVLQELLYEGLRTYQTTWIPSKHLRKFNERAGRILEVAPEEARAFNHNYVGTEHLLLALLRDGDGLAGHALTTLGLTLEGVHTAVVSKIGRGKEQVEGELPYTPRVRRVLSLAVDEAEHASHVFVRTEHILLGLVRDGGGIAADILDSYGVLSKVRERTLALVGS